jgi:hypothetical protein
MDPDEADAQPPVVLGQAMADALSAEEAHRAAVPDSVSPLAQLAYDRWQGELDLTRFRPSPTDEAIRVRLEGWRDGEVADIRSRLTIDDFFTLLAFARRAVVRSLRGNDPEWARAAAEALPMIAADRIDPRDLAWATAVVAWQLQRVSKDAGDTLQAMALRADAEANAILQRFGDDPPARLRDEWGLDVVETTYGVGLAQVGYAAPYEPSADLVAAAVVLADGVDRHGYLADSITIATDLPDVWLRGPDHDEAAATVERMRGCMSVSSDPRPEIGARPMTQMLTVWIVELPTSDGAELVASAATRASGDHVRIARRRGRVACVLVARSTQVGTPPLEDPTTIERLVPVVREVLERAAS